MFELEYRIATRERKLYELFKNILKGFWFYYLEILKQSYTSIIVPKAIESRKLLQICKQVVTRLL